VSVADLLVELRTARGFSQEQLARAAAVSVRALGDIERGRTRRPQRATLDSLSGALRLTGPERERFLTAARRTLPRPARLRPPRIVPPATPTFGRERDVAEVSRMFLRAGVRLLTLLGPGGVGKSRLALEVARALDPYFADVSIVDSVAGTDDRILVVLDEPSAAGVATALARHPRLHVLATARTELRLRGEHLWPVGPLPPEQAVRMLVDRAAAVRPGFALSQANAAALGSLCERAHRIPLEIELVAAMLRAAEPSDVDSELADGTGVVARVVGRLRAEDRHRLRVLSRYPGGVDVAGFRAALGSPVPNLDASLCALAGAALISVTDKAGRAWLSVPGAIRDALR
jgi:transcriptional regulator with XRE-family HTH domain